MKKRPDHFPFKWVHLPVLGLWIAVAAEGTTCDVKSNLRQLIGQSSEASKALSKPVERPLSLTEEVYTSEGVYGRVTGFEPDGRVTLHNGSNNKGVHDPKTLGRLDGTSDGLKKGDGVFTSDGSYATVTAVLPDGRLILHNGSNYKGLHDPKMLGRLEGTSSGLSKSDGVFIDDGTYATVTAILPDGHVILHNGSVFKGVHDPKNLGHLDGTSGGLKRENGVYTADGTYATVTAVFPDGRIILHNGNNFKGVHDPKNLGRLDGTSEGLKRENGVFTADGTYATVSAILPDGHIILHNGSNFKGLHDPKNLGRLGGTSEGLKRENGVYKADGTYATVSAILPDGRVILHNGNSFKGAHDPKTLGRLEGTSDGLKREDGVYDADGTYGKVTAIFPDGHVMLHNGSSFKGVYDPKTLGRLDNISPGLKHGDDVYSDAGIHGNVMAFYKDGDVLVNYSSAGIKKQRPSQFTTTSPQQAADAAEAAQLLTKLGKDPVEDAKLLENFAVLPAMRIESEGLVFYNSAENLTFTMKAGQVLDSKDIDRISAILINSRQKARDLGRPYVDPLKRPIEKAEGVEDFISSPFQLLVNSEFRSRAPSYGPARTFNDYTQGRKIVLPPKITFDDFTDAEWDRFIKVFTNEGEDGVFTYTQKNLANRLIAKRKNTRTNAVRAAGTLGNSQEDASSLAFYGFSPKTRNNFAIVYANSKGQEIVLPASSTYQLKLAERMKIADLLLSSSPGKYQHPILPGERIPPKPKISGPDGREELTNFDVQTRFMETRYNDKADDWLIKDPGFAPDNTIRIPGGSATKHPNGSVIIYPTSKADRDFMLENMTVEQATELREILSLKKVGTINLVPDEKSKLAAPVINQRNMMLHDVLRMGAQDGLDQDELFLIINGFHRQQAGPKGVYYTNSKDTEIILPNQRPFSVSAADQERLVDVILGGKKERYQHPLSEIVVERQPLTTTERTAAVQSILGDGKVDLEIITGFGFKVSLQNSTSITYFHPGSRSFIVLPTSPNYILNIEERAALTTVLNSVKKPKSFSYHVPYNAKKGDSVLYRGKVSRVTDVKGDRISIQTEGSEKPLIVPITDLARAEDKVL